MEETALNEKFCDNFENILQQTLVPRFSNEIVRPCVEEDFKDFKKILIVNLHNIISLLDIVKIEDTWSIKTKNILVKVIVIIGEQHIKSAWNTNEIVKFSKLLTSKICNIFGTKNISEILRDDFFFMVILFLRPKLLKDTWKSFPASVICYKWLLELVETPILKRYIPEILPTTLIIFDDYVLENQMLGLKCINLIIKHCYKSQSLKNFNYDEVIFQALKKMTYKTEYNMINSLYFCISNLLENIEYFENNNFAFVWTKRDEILSILLDNMELQSDPQYRYAYILSISIFLNYNSLGKWSDRLTRILSEYCENYINLEITKATLDFIRTFLSIYQPQGLKFYIVIYGSLLKLLYKLILVKTNIKEVEKVKQCILLLNKLCSNLYKDIFEIDTIKLIINDI